MSTKKYPLETESMLWELMAGTVPNSQTINDLFQDIMKEYIVDTYTVAYLEQSPKFEPEHVERFREIREELGIDPEDE